MLADESQAGGADKGKTEAVVKRLCPQGKKGTEEGPLWKR